MKAIKKPLALLVLLLITINIGNDSYALVTVHIEKALENKPTDYLGVHSSFDRLRNSLRLIRSNKNIDKNAKYFSFTECETYYFNLHRFLNDFDQINNIDYPQQNNSPVKILLLESLQDGFKSTINIDNKGYIHANEFNMKYNLASKSENKKQILEASNTIKSFGKSCGFDFPLHDLLVSIPISYAYVGNNVNNSKEDFLFKGLLNTKNSKISIDYFETKLEPYKNPNRSPIKKKTFINILEKHLTDKDNRSPTIVSMSFALDQKNIELLESIFYDNENSTRIFFHGANTRMSKLIDKIDKNKFIFLVALSNSIPEYDDARLKNSLKKFYNKFPNLILVSQTTYDTNKRQFLQLRRNLSEIDFFSILSPGYDIVPSTDLENIGKLRIDNKSSTSYATPILAAIIFNLWSLNPTLTPINLKKILKESSLNYNQDNIESVGYIVNPKEAYKYVLSELLIKGYKYLYSNCKKAKVYKQGDKFVFNCKSEQETHFSINRFFYEQFYKNSSIYNSVTFDHNTVIIRKKDINTLKYLNPSFISININTIDYFSDKIRISFTKEYSSNSYQDITEKMAEISFNNKGMPFLLSEWPIMVKKGI